MRGWSINMTCSNKPSSFDPEKTNLDFFVMVLVQCTPISFTHLRVIWYLQLKKLHPTYTIYICYLLKEKFKTFSNSRKLQFQWKPFGVVKNIRQWKVDSAGESLRGRNQTGNLRKLCHVQTRPQKAEAEILKA